MTCKKFLILKYSGRNISPEKFYSNTLVGLRKRYPNSSFLSVFEWKKERYKWCFDLNLNDFYHLDSISFGGK